MKSLHLSLALLLFLSAGLETSLWAKKDLVRRRVERLELAEKEWSEQKVSINVHIRVPIYDALGYLAASYEDDAKLAALLNEVRPLARKVKKLSGNSLRGLSFPASLDAELNQDRKALFAAITRVYGSDVSQEVSAYVNKKHALIGGGLLGPLR